MPEPKLDLQPREIANRSPVSITDEGYPQDDPVVRALARAQYPESAGAGVEQPSGIDIGAVIQSAIAAGRPMSEMKEAFDLFERMQEFKALAAYNAALAEFKRTCPKIIRRTENAQFQVTHNGVKRASRYASLADIGDVVDHPLSEVGLSYGWTDEDWVSVPGKLRIGCIIRHSAGHVAEPKFASRPTDTAGAGASPAQKADGIVTYTKRASLKIALGLTDCDDDDDDGAGGTSGGGTITEAQVETILNLLIETNGDATLFAKSYGADRVGDIPAKCFDAACARLNKLRGVKK